MHTKQDVKTNIKKVSVFICLLFIIFAALAGLAACAQTKMYTLTLNHEAGGTVTGGGKYAAGASIPITAEIDTGYAFIGWYEGEQLISAEPSYNLTMPSRDLSLKAVFATDNVAANMITTESRYAVQPVQVEDNYRLDYSYTDGLFDFWFVYLGVVRNVPLSFQTAYYYDGTPINLKYTAREETEQNVTEQNSSAINYSTETRNTNKNTFNVKATASFSAYGFSVGVETGYETMEEKSISKGVNTSTTNTWSTFASKRSSFETEISYTIGGAGQPEGYYRYTLFDDCDVYVAVARDLETDMFYYDYSSFAKGNFSVKLDYCPGPSADFSKSELSSKLVFDSSIVEGFDEPIYDFSTDPSSPHYLTAVAKNDDPSIPSPGGSIKYSGTSSDAYMGYHMTGDTIALEAVPAMGYHFKSWYEGEHNIIGSNELYTVTMGSTNRTIRAVFVQDKNDLVITKSTGGAVTGTAAGKYPYGEIIELTAVPDANYYFDCWNIQSNTYSEETIRLTMPAANLEVHASFLPVGSSNEYALTLTSDTGGSAVVSDGGTTYKAGAQVIIKATSNSGYYFNGWYDGSTLVSDKDEYTLKMPQKNYTLKATFNTTGFQSGAGTSASPYMITTAVQLKRLAEFVNTGANYAVGKYFKLSKDIDLAKIEWTPIGYMHSSTTNYARTFQGNFDGGGYTVKNFVITKNNHSGVADTAMTYGGLFGCVQGAKIANLKVADFNISGVSIAGGLVAFASGNNTEITSCSANGIISTKSLGGKKAVYAGGLIGGISNDMKIAKSYATVSVSAMGTGGDSYNETDVFAGGFIGYASGNFTISNCLATGNVSSSIYSWYSAGYTGGFIGQMAGGTAKYCYASGTVSFQGTGSSNASATLAGGFAGEMHLAYAEDCYATGNVNASAVSAYIAAGGFAGRVQNRTIVDAYAFTKHCYAAGSVSASSEKEDVNAGGFIGRAYGEALMFISYNAKFSDCLSTGNVKAVVPSGKTAAAGGFIGHDGSVSVISNCYRYSGIIILRKVGSSEYSSATDKRADTCSLTNINTQSFYTGNMNWSTTYWNFGTLNLNGGKLPLLKNMPL